MSAQENQFKLSKQFWALPAGLWVILLLKTLLIQGMASEVFTLLAFVALFLFVLPYIGARIAWAVTKRNQRWTEVSFVVLASLVFLVHNIQLYAEAIAERDAPDPVEEPAGPTEWRDSSPPD
ncbi:MAG: hypothetical protein WD490_01040 [Opitutales bacterium]